MYTRMYKIFASFIVDDAKTRGQLMCLVNKVHLFDGQDMEMTYFSKVMRRMIW